MTKDVLLFTEDFQAAEREVAENGGRVTHRLTGAALGARLPEEVDPASFKNSRPDPPPGLDEDSRAMIDVWRAFQAERLGPKRPDPLEGLRWDTPGFTAPCGAAGVAEPEAAPGEGAKQSALSQVMSGSVAVGVVVVSGTQSGLQISDEEYAFLRGKVIESLETFLAERPGAGLTFEYDWHLITVDASPTCNTADCADSGFEVCEAPWRDPALQNLGFPKGMKGVLQYVNHLRSSRRTDWGFAAFLTRYPLCHFAYARRGGPHLCVNVNNAEWGMYNLHKTFAHEVCHIFYAKDEYSNENRKCDCGPSDGRLHIPNYNCVNCPCTHVDCLMGSNTVKFCEYTAWQIGWNNQVLLDSQCLGPSGGSGGGSFEDPPLPRGARISKIRVRSADRVDAVGVSYELNGVAVDLPMHGGGGGNYSELVLDADEYVTGIGGHYAARVDQLVIRTNKREQSYGRARDARYSYQLPTDLQFAGFCGRSGHEVDAIGPMLRQPAGGAGSARVVMGPSGGWGGDAFEDAPIPAGAKIIKVRLRYADRIDAIGLSFKLGGEIHDMAMHGGDGGNFTDFIIDDDDYIVGISGRYYKRIDSLIIQTFKGKDSYRYGGTGGDRMFSYALAPDYELVGLTGRAAREVDALGCIFRKRLP